MTEDNNKGPDFAKETFLEMVSLRVVLEGLLDVFTAQLDDEQLRRFYEIRVKRYTKLALKDLPTTEENN